MNIADIVTEATGGKATSALVDGQEWWLVRDGRLRYILDQKAAQAFCLAYPALKRRYGDPAKAYPVALQQAGGGSLWCDVRAAKALAKKAGISFRELLPPWP